MSEEPRGFTYEVSDEQIDAYRALPIERRIRWIEETARATYALASPEVRARWSRLRGVSPSTPASSEPSGSGRARGRQVHRSSEVRA